MIDVNFIFLRSDYMERLCFLILSIFNYIEWLNFNKWLKKLLVLRYVFRILIEWILFLVVYRNVCFIVFVKIVFEKICVWGVVVLFLEI